MKTRICKNYKRIIATALAVTMLCGTLTACGSKADTMGVTILEFDTAEDLAAIDRETLKNSSNTLYKVGDNYYAFFPSTGKMELVTKVQAYDETNINVIDALYNGTINAEGKTPDVTETYITSVATLDNVLNTRTSYLEHELDNCNANMLIEGADTITLKEYKAQIEEELAQLTQYKQTLVSTSELVVQSLKTQDVQDALLQQISELLDKQLTTAATQNDYNQTVGLATETSVKTLEKLVLAQQSLIETLQQQYDGVEALLANKRVTLETATNLVDTEDFKQVITQLDTYATTYVAECERLYNSVKTKADAIESLYSTIQTADANDYANILTTLQDKYAEMLQTQQELQTQIVALKTAVDGVSVSEDRGVADDGVYALLQTQLDKHEAELAALEDILAGTNLATIDSLANVQNTLQERIKGLENLQNTFKDTMTQQQIDALNALKSDIESSINAETNNTANDLRSYIDALSVNYGNLDSETQKAIDALRKLLDDTNAEQTAVNTAVNTLISNLDTNLAAQQTKLEEQKTMLVDLIDTTTDQVQSDLMSALETSVSTQEQNLAAQKDALTALINSSDADLANTLQTMFNARIDGSNTELNNAITALETALAEDSTATADEIITLRTTLQNKFTEAVDTSETRLAQEREALETLMTAQKNSVISDLTSAIDTVDESRRADVEDILTRLQNSENTNSEALNSAITDLRAILDADIADQENKLSDAKQVLIALMSEKDDDLTALLTEKVNALDETVQTDVNNLLTALNDETANRADAIEAAKTAVTNTLRDSITAQEESLTDTNATLNSFIATTKTNVDSLNNANEVLAGNVTTLSTDLNSLTEAYNEYKQINSQTVNGMSNDLSDLLSNYNRYTQANDSTVTNLNNALSTLDADYEAYKSETGESIDNIDTLLATVKTVTDTNTVNVTTLQTTLETLTSGVITDLQTVQAQISAEVTTLSNTVNDDYAALAAEVTQLTETVTNLTSTNSELSTKVETLETDATNAQEMITNLQTVLAEVQLTLEGKADAADVLTTLPVANATDIGAVKVDDYTVKITPDGTLYVDTSLIGEQIPNEAIKVGTTWANYEDIPVAYRDYCVQANYVNLPTPPDNLNYKTVSENWYAYSKTETVTFSTDTVTETATDGTQYTKVTQVTGTGKVWKLAADRPTKYIDIEVVPVTVCYYGFDDGTGHVLWTQYAVTFDTTATKKTETYKCYKDTYTVGGSYSMVGDSSEITGTYCGTQTKTYLNNWLGDYSKYGPESGYKPSSFIGAYLSGCALSLTQRQKLWDAGVLMDFAADIYNPDNATASSTKANNYARCKRNFLQELAASSDTVTATNEQTNEAMPTDVTKAATTSTQSSSLKMPYNVFNFTDAGTAYKLVYLYGNHSWIYAGTPT